MHRSYISWTCYAGLLLGSASWGEEVPDPLTDRFQVSLGTFFITSRPTVQLDGESSSGDRVDWDHRFGGVDANRIRLDGYWRFADRHKVRVVAFRASRENSEVLDEDIDWVGEIYPVSAEVQAEFSFSILEIAYEYAIVRRENYEIDASFGLHYTTVDASLEAHAEESGGTLTEDLSDSASANAPLPAIGLSGTWSLPHALWLDASAQFFVLSVNPYNGHLQSYRATLTWQPKPWLGIGAGYSFFTINMDVDKEGWHGMLDWRYRGPMLFYRASF
jgi:hypothetical protein